MDDTTMSTPPVRSPCLTCVSSHQGSPPRLPSPLNPSPVSFSNLSGPTPCNSPVGELPGIRSPLRECPDSRLPVSPWSAPDATGSRTPSFPDRSPLMGTVSLQPRPVYPRHPTPSNSPLAQGMSFPSFSPPSSLAGSPQPSMSRYPRPLSPSPNSPRQGSPASIRSALSHFQSHPLCSPPQPPQSHFRFPQSSPVRSRYPRTQSLIQRSSGSPHAVQVAFMDDPRNRRASLGGESRPHVFTRSGPIPVGRSSVQNTLTTVKGDSTPLNEAPIRWWGGQRSWVDDWDNGVHHSHPTHDNTMGMEFVRPEYGKLLTFRDHLEPGGGDREAFLDEEIHASLGTESDALGDPLAPSLAHASMCGRAGYEVEGSPVPRALPMPMAPGTRSKIGNDNPGYGQKDVEPPPVEANSAVQKTPEDLSPHHSCHTHFSGYTNGFIPIGEVPVQVQAPGCGMHGHEHVGGARRRFSDASTSASTSYASCFSGPSRSQSQSLPGSPSQSHASTFPSLSSLGVGIEEAEREGRRSRTFWGRRNSGSRSTMRRQDKEVSHGTGGHSDHICEGGQYFPSVQDGENGLAHTKNQGERLSDVKAERTMERSDPDPKQSVAHVHGKEMAKHGSLFFRIGPKHGDVFHEQAQREGYNRAEQCVSLAITSILPAKTITMLSPVGEALVRAKESAKFVGYELAPVIKDTLSMSADILSFAPLPGLEEAAKALLSVWDACQKVDTNRLSCLRLAERCATLLYSVRCEINEAGSEIAMTLAEPVQRLCGALAQIQTFLRTQLHRPFLKRYVRREEIARELIACNEAITDAASRFGNSIQIRTYRAVCSAASESKRFAQEAQAMLTMDHQIIQRHYAMMFEQQVQAWRKEAVAGFSGEGAAPLTINGAPVRVNGHLHGAGAVEQESDDNSGEGYWKFPPACGLLGQPPPATMVGPSPALGAPLQIEFEFGQNTATPSILSTDYPYDATDSTASAPPTPTRTTFIMGESRTRTTRIATTKTENIITDPASPMRALTEVHRAQDSVDAAVDEAALRGALTSALDARNDVEMVRYLQVARGEIPEATETLRRMLSTGAEVEVHGNDAGVGTGNSDLDRKFMQSGVEAMTRLTSPVAQQSRLHENPGAVGAPQLPNWTITRYEVIRTRKIGVGFFSDVYLGRWRNRQVVIKVLAHCVSREAFVLHIERWNALDHPNVLPLYGASSAVGEKPWFFVSKFCSGGSLVALLKSAKPAGLGMVRNDATGHVDLLRCMYEIAKGMAYLHECGVSHGDLRTANVLIDENGRCVLSDFGQSEIRSEAYQSCGQPEPHSNRWKAPERLMGGEWPTNAADVYAFAMCCVEILDMGNHPWATLDDKTIYELVLDKDERPPVPMLSGYVEATNAVADIVHSCWVREPGRRPSFASVAALLEEVWRLQGRGDLPFQRALTPITNFGFEPVTSTESSPADEQYETAPESMTTDTEEENMDSMTDVPLTSPGPARLARSMDHDATTHHAEGVRILAQVPSGTLEYRVNDMPAPSWTNDLDVDTRNEENYRLLVGLNHSFDRSLTLPLWSPTRVELGAVGYLSKPKGEFITLFNAIDPLQSCEERLRYLPSVYGYGKFEVQRREDGKRNVAQRGLDAISVFLTFKARGDRSHSERIARQYAFPLERGKPSAHLCVEKTMYQYMDHLEAPIIWFKQHVDLVLEVYAPYHTIRREDLILVVGTLDAPDWAAFVSDNHSDGRAQFSVFASREKGEPWGMYTMERAVKSGDAGQGRWMDVGRETFASKVSCTMQGGQDVTGETVILAGLRFEQGMEAPKVM